MTVELPIADLDALLATIIDTESVSENEAALADAVEAALRSASHLKVERLGNTIWGRTELGRAERVIIAGHLDTVPVADNLPSRLVTIDGESWRFGRGASDMKGGVAIMLQLACELTAPNRDITWVFYDCEEIAASRSGLGRLATERPETLHADLAVLMEPSDGVVEAGCQGTMRFTITCQGVAAHSARGWLGHNAIHDAAGLLNAVLAVQKDFGEVEVDGMIYREGLNATMIDGGVSGNVIPDRCRVQINYRFAPSTSEAEAEERMRRLFARFGQFEVLDLSCGARPGLGTPVVQAFVAATGGTAGPKFGWTDVARFGALGIPALNFGPGDPALAHRADEAVKLSLVHDCADALRRWLIEA